MPTAYKVLRGNGTEFESINSYDCARVVYRKGKLAKPPKWLADEGFGLFCFRTPENAVEFIRNEVMAPMTIFVCEVEYQNEVPLPQWRSIFLLAQGIISPPCETVKFPDGSFTVSSLTITHVLMSALRDPLRHLYWTAIDIDQEKIPYDSL
jgi:hypothetical protein